MFDRNIPKHFWGDAVLNLLIAAYLINRMPSKVLNFQTLIGTLKECYPHLSVFSSLPLEVFGSTLFVHVPSKDKFNFNLKTVKCNVPGYSLNQKGYKSYHLITDRKFVIMDESFFE